MKISRFYRSILRDRRAPIETKEFIKKRLRSAQWLIEALTHRKHTITRVCEYLSCVQKDFLEKGDSAVKPFTLREAAEGLSVTEATVSRVVSNKYAHISDRLFAIKDFFAGSIETVDGNIVSDRNIQQRIRRIIEEEGAKPLSDTKIASMLKAEGINIARRTITKYRERLGIFSSRFRRK